MKLLISAALALFLAAACMPETMVQTGAQRPAIMIKGAPEGAILYVDGLQIGPASKYDGNPNVLNVLEGLHQIEVRQGATVVHQEKTYVSNGETRPVVVVTGAQK